MKNETIATADINTLLSIIPNGSIFTVTFVKKDRTERVMNCRKGVKSHLNPNPSRPRPAMPSNLVTVFDMQAGEYRQFNMNTTTQIKTCGTLFTVTP